MWFWVQWLFNIIALCVEYELIPTLHHDVYKVAHSVICKSNRCVCVLLLNVYRWNFTARRVTANMNDHEHVHVTREGVELSVQRVISIQPHSLHHNELYRLSRT